MATVGLTQDRTVATSGRENMGSGECRDHQMAPEYGGPTNKEPRSLITKPSFRERLTVKLDSILTFSVTSRALSAVLIPVGDNLASCVGDDLLSQLIQLGDCCGQLVKTVTGQGVQLVDSSCQGSFHNCKRN